MKIQREKGRRNSKRGDGILWDNQVGDEEENNPNTPDKPEKREQETTTEDRYSSSYEPHILVHKISSQAVIPERQTAGSAELDKAASHAAVIEPYGRDLIHTGLQIEVPYGYYGQLASRSGLAWKSGIEVGAGVIDSDYRGEYVGLTGARLDGPEMLACGLATHFVPSMKLALLEEALAKVDTSDHFSICSVIDRFSNNVPVKESSAFKSLDVIDKCFSKETVEEILSSLELEAVNAADEWIKGAIQSLKKASPMSLKITLRAIREGRTQGIGQCLIKDYRLCCHILRKEASKDFFEGCRALLVVKDKNPKWEPSRLDLVDDKAVDNCFSAVDDANWEDLRLPARPGLSFKYGSKL
ncbi:3-hydroxyisobutyryl-CoA hydrolase 1-like isoform X3 [Zingiber officinale]|nr:3-hydroxyisobutyryl-CoA hydrolase 1-like isoform X3 [Zingiber officinale]